MEKRQFVEALGIISKHFGTEWPIDALNAAYEQVSSEAVETLHAAQKRVYLDFAPRPQPPIGRIVAVIVDEGRKHRMRAGTAIEDEWNQQKRGGDQAANRFFDAEKKAKHGRQAITLINNRLEGKMSQEQYVICLGQMAREYPGCGWEELRDDEALKPAREANQRAAGEA